MREGLLRQLSMLADFAQASADLLDGIGSPVFPLGRHDQDNASRPTDGLRHI